jgi:hypothetical protein
MPVAAEAVTLRVTDPVTIAGFGVAVSVRVAGCFTTWRYAGETPAALSESPV